MKTRMTAARQLSSGFRQHFETKDDFGSRTSLDSELETVKLGAAVGTAVGGAAGFATGMVSTMQNEKSEHLVTESITHPEYQGYDYSTSRRRKRVCTGFGENETCRRKTVGHYHNYTPDIKNRVVGQYERPEFTDSTWLDPFSGALIGMVAGGALGLLTGAAIVALKRASAPEPVRSTINTEKLRGIESGDNKRVLVGAALGAGAGATLGAVTGAMETARGSLVERTFEVPVTKRLELGLKPPNTYERGRFISDRSDAPATEPVVRDVPVYDDQGQPQMEEVTRTYDTARFGPLKGALYGGAVGLGIGIAGGVAVNVLQRVVNSEKAFI